MTPKRGEFWRRKADGVLVLIYAAGKYIVRTRSLTETQEWCPPVTFAQAHTGPVAVDWVERDGSK